MRIKDVLRGILSDCLSRNAKCLSVMGQQTTCQCSGLHDCDLSHLTYHLSWIHLRLHSALPSHCASSPQLAPGCLFGRCSCPRRKRRRHGSTRFIFSLFCMCTWVTSIWSFFPAQAPYSDSWQVRVECCLLFYLSLSACLSLCGKSGFKTTALRL